MGETEDGNVQDTKKEYTAEFKDLAVKRVKMRESVGAVVRDLGAVDQPLRRWVKAAKAGKLPEAKTATPDQMELSRVRGLRAARRARGGVIDGEDATELREAGRRSIQVSARDLGRGEATARRPASCSASRGASCMSSE